MRPYFLKTPGQRGSTHNLGSDVGPESREYWKVPENSGRGVLAGAPSRPSRVFAGSGTNFGGCCCSAGGDGRVFSFSSPSPSPPRNSHAPGSRRSMPPTRGVLPWTRILAPAASCCGASLPTDLYSNAWCTVPSWARSWAQAVEGQSRVTQSAC